MMNFEALSKEFKILCEKKKLELTPSNVFTKSSCHLAVEHPQVCFNTLHWFCNENNKHLMTVREGKS